MKRLLLIVGLAMIVLACGSTASAPNPDAGAIDTAVAQTQIALMPAPAAGPSPTPQPLPTEKPAAIPAPARAQVAKVGDRVVQGDYALTVANVEQAKEYGQFASADAGKKFVAVEIIIESGAGSGVSVNPFYCSIQDSDGYQYNMNAFGKEPSLAAQNDLPAGEKMRGWVTFEVPETATGLIFKYDPLSFSTSIRILVDLGL